MEQRRRGGIVGTGCFEVLSSMYSHVSEQVPQRALRMYLFALCIRYPCSAAEGQIAMAILCRRGWIL